MNGGPSPINFVTWVVFLFGLLGKLPGFLFGVLCSLVIIVEQWVVPSCFATDGKSVLRKSSRGGQAFFPRYHVLWFFILSCRVGEAVNPGPSWSLGVCNPSGLQNKTDIAAQLDGTGWVISETHFTAKGVSNFRRGLQSLRSPFCNAIAGAPCQAKPGNDVGSYSGVMLLTRAPARALPHNFDDESFATSRLQVAGMLIGSTWVQIGMLYGYPVGATHRSPKYQTELLLEQLITRIGHQTVGPRIIAGDFNFDTHELSQLQRLRDLGFREVQDIMCSRGTHVVTPTGKGARRIDHMWLSPELQTSLQSIQIRPDDWADHKAILAHFDGGDMDSPSSVWRMPVQFPWPKDWQCFPSPTDHLDPSIAYGSFWHEIESQHRSGKQQLTRLLPLSIVDELRRSPLANAGCSSSRPGWVDTMKCSQHTMACH